ncbi:MAG TPA: zf-HC2 domain-containing protein [Lachnospiraceae bacterium]|nr:zf-HC2 domain-containing protein [Lachnospiraceae bacterium]
MNCKESEKLIGQFIRNELEDKELELFVLHTKSCKSCMEELSIQYLVEEGMNRLEEGGAFDLQGELEMKLMQSLTKARFRRRMQRFYFIAEVFAIIAIAIVAFTILF